MSRRLKKKLVGDRVVSFDAPAPRCSDSLGFRLPVQILKFKTPIVHQFYLRCPVSDLIIVNFINCLKVFYVIFAFVFHMYSTVMHINVLFLLISLTDI